MIINGDEQSVHCTLEAGNYAHYYDTVALIHPLTYLHFFLLLKAKNIFKEAQILLEHETISDAAK